MYKINVQLPLFSVQPAPHFPWTLTPVVTHGMNNGCAFRYIQLFTIKTIHSGTKVRLKKKKLSGALWKAMHDLRPAEGVLTPGYSQVVRRHPKQTDFSATLPPAQALDFLLQH